MREWRGAIETRNDHHGFVPSSKRNKRYDVSILEVTFFVKKKDTYIIFVCLKKMKARQKKLPSSVTLSPDHTVRLSHPYFSKPVILNPSSAEFARFHAMFDSQIWGITPAQRLILAAQALFLRDEILSGEVGSWQHALIFLRNTGTTEGSTHSRRQK